MSTTFLPYYEEVEEYVEEYVEEDIPEEVEEKYIPEYIQEGSGFIYYELIDLSKEIQYFLWEQSLFHGLDYEMLLALIFHESSFRTDIVSYNTNGTYDTGLMQVNSGNQELLESNLGVLNLMCPYDNIQAATWYIAYVRDKYNPVDMHHLLMMYNMGPTGARRARENGNLTSQFSRKIINTRENLLTYSTVVL